MDLRKPVLLLALVAPLAFTSGCDLVMAEEEVVDPVTGAVTTVPVGPPRPSEPREPRGGGGGGGWG